MTRRCRCSLPAPARPRRLGSGPMPATSVPGVGMLHPQLGIASRATEGANIPRTISPASVAGCTPMAMPGSRISIDQATSAKLPAWPMSGASSSTSTGRRAPPSPKRLSAGSPGSTPSRRTPEGPRQVAVPNCEETTLPRSSTTWSDGWPCNSPRSQENPRSRPPYAMRSPEWNACAPTSTTESLSWITTPPNAACAPSRMVSHYAPLLQVSGNIGSWSRLTV